MGYTHYIRNKRAFTDAEWKSFTSDVKVLLANSAVPLANGHGNAGTKPEFKKTYIMFNGVEDDGHETAIITKAASSFDFCKTARKPYDKVVVEFYKLVRKYIPDVELSSDGGDAVFNTDMTKIKVDGKWTYDAAGFDVKVGDTVILPPTPYNTHNWEGKVTAIGSDYNGYTKTIIGVKQNLTLEEKIAKFLGDEFSLHTLTATSGATKIVNIVAKHLRS